MQCVPTRYLHFCQNGVIVSYTLNINIMLVLEIVVDRLASLDLVKTNYFPLNNHF